MHEFSSERIIIVHVLKPEPRWHLLDLMVDVSLMTLNSGKAIDFPRAVDALAICSIDCVALSP